MLTEREKWLMGEAWDAARDEDEWETGSCADWLSDRIGDVTVEMALAEEAPAPTWTSEPPTEPGWYWFRTSDESRPTVVHSTGYVPAGGQWLGPLEVPE